MEKYLFGFTNLDLRRLAFQLAERNGLQHPFKNGCVGKDWVNSFLRRHQDLSLRKPESTFAQVKNETRAIGWCITRDMICPPTGSRSSLSFRMLLTTAMKCEFDSRMGKMVSQSQFTMLLGNAFIKSATVGRHVFTDVDFLPSATTARALNDSPFPATGSSRAGPTS
ncbi:hypothetical protein ILUMI_18701, partial [Ignelater luminosus]